MSKFLICHRQKLFRFQFIVIFRHNVAAMTFVWPENQTRSASELILPRERTTVISPAGVCNRGEAGGGGAKAKEQGRDYDYERVAH